MHRGDTETLRKTTAKSESTEVAEATEGLGLRIFRVLAAFLGARRWRLAGLWAGLAERSHFGV